ncbi:sigma-54-dependent transcriptional regulator [Methylovirgula sp. 4M-Z18]|uniref:sigma-54-dependent transcriptional regulator n=1 Tax=Methylovirgula sp. 4M-Z18 TaxID=2293567 RepID=UPI000E2EFDE5|nr:sigma-54 dependent transcriptional regulator [Methylovirgula sp. 4M-Z18]RFB75552.1 sigma-54-dependent Fis family transcriptional regulator [Methylovirgula sp. 4M-Z18]
MAKPYILLVDDEIRLVEVLSVALQAHGFEAVVAGSVDEGLKLLDSEPINLVITDLKMPGKDGRHLLHSLRRDRPQLPVIVMTAYASVRDAVDLVKEGAFDYVAKPFEVEDVVATIERALKLTKVETENRRLREEMADRYSFDNLIGSSASFQSVLRQIGEVCATRTTVLLQGESGTGKELVARAIHFNSDRASGPFIAVNCAAIPEGLLESELFGHVKGAFTGAVSGRDGRFRAADGGTIFLDEIGDMPVTTQVKVLRVLQEQSFEPVGSSKTMRVDVRVVAATHKNLQEMIAAGQFREDLFYRLNVYPIHLPPLRERGDDIPILASHFLKLYNDRMGKKIVGLTPAAEKALRTYAWPGNIRELQNCIERAILVCQETSIDLPDLPKYVFEGGNREVFSRLPQDLDAELERLERSFILNALRETQGVQVKAAALLGIAERSLWHRIKKLGIKIERSING